MAAKTGASSIEEDGGESTQICNYCEVQAKITPGYTISPATKVCGACSSMKYWCDTCIKGHNSLYNGHAYQVRNASTSGKAASVAPTSCQLHFDGDGNLVVSPLEESATTVENVIKFLQTGKNLVLENNTEVKKALETHHKSSVMEIKSKFSKACAEACEEADALFNESCSLVNQSTTGRIAGYDGAMYKLSTYSDYLKEGNKAIKAKSEHHEKSGCIVDQLSMETLTKKVSEDIGSTLSPKVKLKYFGIPAKVVPHAISLPTMQDSIAEFICVNVKTPMLSGIHGDDIKDCYRVSDEEVLIAAGRHGLFHIDKQDQITKRADGPCWGVCVYIGTIYYTTYDFKMVRFKPLRNTISAPLLTAKPARGFGGLAHTVPVDHFQVHESQGLSGISAFQDGRLAVVDEKLEKITVHTNNGQLMLEISQKSSNIQIGLLAFPKFVNCRFTNTLLVSCKHNVLKLALNPCEVQWSCTVANGNAIKAIGGNLFVCQTLEKGRALTAINADTGEIKGQIDLPDIGTAKVVSVTEATWCQGKIKRVYVNTW